MRASGAELTSRDKEIAPVRAAAKSAHSASALECELKLEGDAAALESAFASLSSLTQTPVSNDLTSVYFDTPERALWRSGYVLRVRTAGRSSLQANQHYVQTLKWPEVHLSPDSRNELEVECPSDEPELGLFGEQTASEISRLAAGAALSPRFRTHIRRRALMIAAGNSTIEAAFDTGNIMDGKKTVPVREIELELKQGDPADLYQFAEQLSAAYNLRLGVLTKSQRGFLLAPNEALAIRKQQSPALNKDMRVDDLIALALNECIDHFILNWPAFLLSDNPDAVHQMRVSMRRLRSILKTFYRELQHPDFQAFRNEAKEIASAMGTARDTDVFLDMLNKGPLKYCARDSSMDEFVRAAMERREEGYGQAHAMLAAPQTTRFILELRSFVARRGWQAGLATSTLIALGEPAGKFAARTLERLHHKARKSGKSLAQMPPGERHELRIILKNLRYNAEIFADLFASGRGVRKYNRAVAALQDVLGTFNDGEVAAAIIADVERRAGLQAVRAAGLVTGWTGSRQSGSDADLMVKFKEFKNARKFWL